MERHEIARLKSGSVLWVEDTGERVLLRWLTVDGVRCTGAAGDRTYWLDELVEREPAAKAARHDPLGKRKVTRRAPEREPKRDAVSERQLKALETLSAPELELWYHDLGAQTADALLARGWAREVGRVRCARAGHTHPGALSITPAGLDALREASAAIPF